MGQVSTPSGLEGDASPSCSSKYKYKYIHILTRIFIARPWISKLKDFHIDIASTYTAFSFVFRRIEIIIATGRRRYFILIRATHLRKLKPANFRGYGLET